jgi:L-ribulose-5-phosphate 3-epimerase UlaE
MRRGVHEHLMFGEGEMNFGEVFDALRTADYRGGVFVELSRHSHDAVETARRSLAFLTGVRGQRSEVREERSGVRSQGLGEDTARLP